MNRRRWTEEEIDFLFENYGKRSLQNLTRNLGRSEASVSSKAATLGLQLNTAQTWFTVSEFCEVTEISRSTVQYWIKKFGFPARRNKRISKKYVQINPQNFWRWAEKNKQLIQWAEFPRYALGKEPKWVKETRTASARLVNKRRPWSRWELEELKYLLNQNKFTYPELSERLNRSQGAIKRKIYDLELPWPVYINRKAVDRYTQEEIDKAIELYVDGYPLAEVAKMIGRTEAGLRGKIERSGFRFAGKKLEKVN